MESVLDFFNFSEHVFVILSMSLFERSVPEVIYSVPRSLKWIGI